MQVMEDNVRGYLCLGQQNIILNSLKKKIQVIRKDLEVSKKYIPYYQKALNHEVQLHSEAKTIIKNLENQLEESQHKVHNANATICSSQNKRKTLERQLQIQADKIDAFEKELIKFSEQVKDADENAQYCSKRVNHLSDSLNRGDKQLQASRLKNVQLEKELKAAAKNLHCVEHAFERSSQMVLIANRKIVELQQRLQESEHRAYQAELHVHQLQHNFNNLEQNLEKRWQHILRKLNQR